MPTQSYPFKEILNKFEMRVVWDDNLKTLKVYSRDNKGSVLIKENPEGEGLIVIFPNKAEFVSWGGSFALNSRK